MDGEKIKCPCNHRKCQNRNYLDEDTVKVHLRRNGFVTDYYRWYHHGETYVPQPIEQIVGRIDAFVHTKHGETFNAMQSMVYDAAGPFFNSIEIEESLNPITQHLFDMLKASERCVEWEHLWPFSIICSVQIVEY